MTFTSDPVATAVRVKALRRYLDGNVLDPSRRCVCRNLDRCRRSALFDQHGVRRTEGVFSDGQLSHLGHHYDLRHNGAELRVLVVAMDTGRTRRGVTLEDRRSEVLRLADGKRNPHMIGVLHALRLAIGREPGRDRDGEYLRLKGGRSRVHLFDAYAMANLRLCSATDGTSTKSLGTATMSRNCLPHLAATIKILLGRGRYRLPRPTPAGRPGQQEAAVTRSWRWATWKRSRWRNHGRGVHG